MDKVQKLSNPERYSYYKETIKSVVQNEACREKKRIEGTWK
jgi:hypothetical protein